MTVWDDILSQAENLQHVVETHAASGRPVLEKAARLAEKAGWVIFTGVGSGLNATMPAVCYLMSRGRPAQFIDATELIYHLTPGLKGSLLVLNTRSGETAELIRAAEMARSQGVATIAVTNEVTSTTARLADVCIPTHSRWDDLVVISAYGGMLATELALAGQMVGEQEAMLSGLHTASRSAGDVLAACIEKRQELAALFAHSRPVYLLGRGASAASTHGGALVIEEMSRRPCTPMAAGLFRQGPVEVVDESFRAIMFEGGGSPARLNKILAEELIKKGAGLAWVGASRVEGALNITLPELPWYILPLLEIIPCHVLAYDLARMAGIEPGSVRYIQKVITGEEGLPNQ